MAGDWISVEHTTPDKPEVYKIAETLGIDPDAVVGKLVRIWVWADQQTLDGNAPSVTKLLLDRVTHCAGFGEAMEKAGWLRSVDGTLVFPNFDRHNLETAKQRALTRKRVTKHRARCNAERNAGGVTSALPTEQDSITLSSSSPPEAARAQDEEEFPEIQTTLPATYFTGRGYQAPKPLEGHTDEVRKLMVKVRDRYIAWKYGTQANVPASHDLAGAIRTLANAIAPDPKKRAETLLFWFKRPTLDQNAMPFHILKACGLDADTAAKASAADAKRKQRVARFADSDKP